MALRLCARGVGFRPEMGAQPGMIVARGGQAGQGLAERGQHPGLDGVRRVGQTVIHPLPFPFPGHPAGIVQVGQMPRHPGLRQSKGRHHVADAQFSMIQKPDDAQPGRIGQGLSRFAMSSMT